MPQTSRPLRVDPTELHLTSGRIDAHAAEFGTEHQAAHARAGGVSLGSGASKAALPAMLAAWEADAARFGRLFTTHAEGHRAAADSYVTTDERTAEGIGDARTTM